MNLLFNIISFVILLGFLVGLCLFLKRLYVFVCVLYHLIQAYNIYTNIKNTLKVYSTGDLSHDQKQTYCFNRFNKLFYHIYKMCQHGIFFPLATVDIQKCFWMHFLKQHPLFYMRGFSLWDLQTYANTIMFVHKYKIKKSPPK